MKYGLTINNFRTFCALVLGVHFGPNIHSKMTLRTKSTYPNLSWPCSCVAVSSKHCSCGYLDRVLSTGRLPPRETVPGLLWGDGHNHDLGLLKYPTKMSSCLWPPHRASHTEFCWRNKNVGSVRTTCSYSTRVR